MKSKEIKALITLQESLTSTKDQHQQHFHTNTFITVIYLIRIYVIKSSLAVLKWIFLPHQAVKRVEGVVRREMQSDMLPLIRH